MKDRPQGFMSKEKLDHDGEIFDYIRELHDYLWRFIRISCPRASGPLGEWLDKTLEDIDPKIVNEPQYRLWLELKGGVSRIPCSLSEEIVKEGVGPKDIKGTLLLVRYAQARLSLFHPKETYTIEKV